MRRALTIATLVIVAVAQPAEAAREAECRATSVGTTNIDGGAVEASYCVTALGDVEMRAAPTGESSESGATSSIACAYLEADTSQDVLMPSGKEAIPEPGRVLFQWCADSATGLTVSAGFVTIPETPGPVTPQIDPQVLAEHARAQLVLPLPEPRSWPGIDRPQITGLSTWLHVDNFAGASQTATAGPVRATVTAEPVEVVWVMGDGVTVSCGDAGAVYGVDHDTSCEHVFTVRSTGRGDDHYHGSVSIRWRLRWEATTGDGGGLGDVTRTTPIDWFVQELQATVR
jgi:hypothetical protein